MSKKHKKWEERNHRPEHHEPPPQHVESGANTVYTVRIEPSPEDKDNHAQENTYKEKQLEAARKLNWISAFGAGIALLALAALVWNGFLVHESNRINKNSSDLANRPYVGVDSIESVYMSQDDKGVVHASQTRSDITQTLDFKANIKNFGPVPATDFSAHWRIFIGAEEQSTSSVPATPSTFYPGEYSALVGGTGISGYNAIKAGRELVVEITIEYNGPSGPRNHECTKEQFAPEVKAFYILGHCTH